MTRGLVRQIKNINRMTHQEIRVESCHVRAPVDWLELVPEAGEISIPLDAIFADSDLGSMTTLRAGSVLANIFAQSKCGVNSLGSFRKFTDFHIFCVQRRTVLKFKQIKTGRKKSKKSKTFTSFAPRFPVSSV